jgi:hypothetical protein
VGALWLISRLHYGTHLFHADLRKHSPTARHSLPKTNHGRILAAPSCFCSRHTHHVVALFPSRFRLLQRSLRLTGLRRVHRIRFHGRLLRYPKQLCRARSESWPANAKDSSRKPERRADLSREVYPSQSHPFDTSAFKLTGSPCGHAISGQKCRRVAILRSRGRPPLLLHLQHQDATIAS